MEQELIAAEIFCSHHQIDAGFILALRDFGLIEVQTISDRHYIPSHQIYNVERFIRLHYDLDINLEGIEAITHLLNRVSDLQEELNLLKNRLRLYES